MTWKVQANNSRKKAYNGLHKIKKIGHYLDNDMIFLLLNALVLPHINYCISTWSSTSPTNSKKFDTLFRQIEKFYPLNRNINQLIKYNKAVMVFKSMHKLCPSYISDKLQLVQHQHHHRTRASTENDLITTHATNKFASKTFLKTSSRIWNDLPTIIKTTQSLVNFKSLIKKHFFNI